MKQAVAAGSKVVLADLRLNDEAETFVKEHGGKDLVFQKCDVSKKRDQERLVEVAEERWGDVPDVYVSSAGLFEPVSAALSFHCCSFLVKPQFWDALPSSQLAKRIPRLLPPLSCPFSISVNKHSPHPHTQSFSNFWTDTEDDDYATVAVNVTAPIKLARIAVRALLHANKRGVVLLVASIAGYGGTYAVPLYCATKHAVVGFVKSMRKAEAEEGVKVVTLCPGVVRTPLWTPQAGDDLIKNFGYHESIILEPGDVAKAAVGLVEGGRYGGGTVLEVTTSGTRVIPEWGVEPPPRRKDAVPSDIVPPLKMEVKEYLAGERGKAKS